MNILFVNCCIRGEASRTMGLCRAALEEIRAKYPDAAIQELCLDQEEICPLHSDTLARRNALEHQKDFSDPMFRYAQQFAEAEIVVDASCTAGPDPALHAKGLDVMEALQITVLNR